MHVMPASCRVSMNLATESISVWLFDDGYVKSTVLECRLLVVEDTVTMAGSLTRVRVLDLTRLLSGPYATMILADLGADVIKIEQPGVGDLSRGSEPLIGGVSSTFLSLNHGKKSVTLDLKSDIGREILLGLVEESDVVVENFVPGAMERLGINYDVMREHNPRIVYAAISGYGQTGPDAHKAALDIVVQARGGIMSLTGEPGGPPIRPGTSYADIIAGLYAVIGILGALAERQRSGLGQFIDISMLDCQLAVQEGAVERYVATGEVPGATGTRHPTFTPFQAFKTGDGYLVVAIIASQWPLFCATIDHVELIDDIRFATGELRTRNYSILEPLILEVLGTRTTAEWLNEFDKVEIPCSDIRTIDQVIRDPQIVARQMVRQITQPGIGVVEVVGSPIKLSRTPSVASGPAPELGEHTEQVLSSLLKTAPDRVRQLRELGII
jgi:CoA:oxalate CoA-transferase